MKYIFFLIFLFACRSTPPKYDISQEFGSLRGCFLLYNMNTKKLVKQWGETCYEHYPAYSTFKVPLAVMAFDSGVLKNQEHIMKWDGKKHRMDQWNKDQNPRTWMKYSVVWFSQKITPLIGETKLQKYLKDFQYGNMDISAGIRDAWLKSPEEKKALKISPLEQLDFLKRLWTNQLKASNESMNLTKEIMFIESSPTGYKLSGKTGSGSYSDDNRQLGWFISHLSNGKNQFLTVTQISDTEEYTGVSYGGMRAKEITLRILVNQGLW